MKFTIRDLFWLMLVVGIATAWLITLIAAPPEGSSVKGKVYSRGKPFEGRIFLRSHDGRVISAPVHKGDFDLKYCSTGTYEVIYEGAEEDLRYLNDGNTFHINSYGDYFFGIGSPQDADPSMTVFPSIVKRRDNWRISRAEELNE